MLHATYTVYVIDRIERAGPAVIVTGVRKAYGTHTVLDGVRLEIARGTVYALLGVNGAGKTTLVNILSTLVRADAGHVRVAGADVAGDPAGVRRALSLTGQFAAVDEVLTGRENLTLFAALLGVPRARRARVVDAQLERFGLTANADQRVGSYSGGTRRRLDLAVSLLRVPEVLVLDEPTTGLDTRSRHDLWAFIRQLTTEGLTVLLTTQYLDEADALADRVGVLSGGRIVIEGTPAELKASVGSERVELVDAHRAVVAAETTDGTLGGLRQALGRLGSAPDDLDVQVRRPTLDDVFWAFTGSRPPSERPDAEDTPLLSAEGEARP